VVPTGVDTDYFQQTADGEENGALIFLGSMDAIVNEDAVSWFVHEILPSVRNRVPDAHFYIVGRNPTPVVQRLHAPSQGVTVTNTVHDVRPYLSRAQAFVVPMRVGGGTRIKIYEGMAAGKAVVSTSLGAEGLHLTSGRNVLLADTNCQFADAVVNVLTDHDFRSNLAKEAHNFVCKQFPWSKVINIFETACIQAAKPPKCPKKIDKDIRWIKS
jgi:glycosyltransferase involved in cell wall biosynthesis